MYSKRIKCRFEELPIEIIDGDRSSRYPKKSEFMRSGIIFLNTTNIVDNKLNLADANFVSEEKFFVIIKGRLKPLDIVIATRGNGIGKARFWNEEIYSKPVAKKLKLGENMSNTSWNEWNNIFI